MFADADDWFSKEAMKLSIEGSKEYDIVRFGYTSVFDPDSVQTKNSVLQSTDTATYLKLVIERKTTMAVWGAIYRRRLFTENKIYFNTSLRAGEDWLVLVNLIINSKEVKILPIPLYYYNRYNEQGCINSFNFEKSKELLSAFCKVEELIEKSQHNNISLTSAHITILNELLSTFIEAKTPIKEFKSHIAELNNIHHNPTIKEYISANTSIKNKLRTFLYLHFPFIYNLIKK